MEKKFATLITIYMLICTDALSSSFSTLKLAEAAEKNNQLNEAIMYYEELFDLVDNQLGPHHTDVEQIASKLIYLYGRTYRFNERNELLKIYPDLLYDDTRPSKKSDRSEPHPRQANVTVNGLRYMAHENGDFARVVVQLNRDTQYKCTFLEKDPDSKTPMSFYIDIRKSRLSDTLKGKDNDLRIPINRFLELRIGQNKPDIVRVVLYNHPHNGLEFTKKNYKITRYLDPFRIVIDVIGPLSESHDKRDEKEQGTSCNTSPFIAIWNNASAGAAFINRIATFHLKPERFVLL